MKAVSGKEFCKTLQKNGWTFRRIRGSHHIYRKGDITVSVPVHGNKSLKKGTQGDLMKKTGITEKDLS
jgi:predicted RNA binding protein YcfA (HicA-like mRNA interferase family)